ncbi:MAG TPA: hypothetical protein VGK73_38785 [Polyangiaceae bacterium]
MSKPQELIPWIAYLRSDPSKQAVIPHAEHLREAREKAPNTLRSALRSKVKDSDVDVGIVCEGEKVDAAKARILAQAMGASA